MDSIHHLAYVTAGFAGFLYVIDTSRRELVDTISVPDCPALCARVALDDGKSRMYYFTSGELAIFDTSTRHLISTWSMPVPYAPYPATGAAIDPSRDRLYVMTDDELFVLDTSKLDMPELPATGGPLLQRSSTPVEVGAGLALIGALVMLGSGLWRRRGA